MKITYVCLNCRKETAEYVANRLEREYIAQSGACCPACRRIAYGA